MGIIEWNVNFYTGLPEVDSQHQRLVALANRLSEVDRDQPEVLEQAFQELRDYARDHFSEEERLMAEAGIDPEHLRYHKNAHALFVSRLSGLWAARQDATGETMAKLLDFLTTWILQHILHTDRKMALEVHERLGTRAPHNMFTHF